MLSKSRSFLKYFPLGIAKGKAFCNRDSERKQLAKNFEAGQHTLISSPRRYGKSSLAIYAITESRLPYERVDLFVAVDTKTIESKIIQGVKNLLSKVTTSPEQAISLIKNYFKKLRMKWIIGTDGINIELTPRPDSDPISNILDSLQLLEKILNKKNKRAIFFIDEFQEIGVLTDAKKIEGAIRCVAQETTHLIFVFSGSNRHILSDIFDNRTKPLYMLCDRINLERISEEHYHKYLNHVAKLSWGKTLDAKVMETIFQLTERHPYYVNALCNKIWSICQGPLPGHKIIEEIWQDYVFQEEAKTAKELSILSGIQKKLLISISQGRNREFATKTILITLGATSAGVSKALRVLKNRDLIEMDREGCYRIVDPLIKASLELFYTP